MKNKKSWLVRRMQVHAVLLYACCMSCASAPAQNPSTVEPARYFVSTARQAHLIDSVFPYDIKLLTTKGDTVVSSEVLRGNTPLVMLFWLTTCGPCRAELEAFRTQFDTMQTVVPFRLVTISTDFPNRESIIRERAAAWPWPTYWDYNREFSLIMPGGLNGLPQVFVFDTTGQLRYHKRRYNTGSEWQVIDAIRKLQ